MKTNHEDQQTWYNKTVQPYLNLPHQPRNHYITVPITGLSTKRSIIQTFDSDTSMLSATSTLIDNSNSFMNHIPNNHNNNNNNNNNSNDNNISLPYKRLKTTTSTSASTSDTITHNYKDTRHTNNGVSTSYTMVQNGNISPMVVDNDGFEYDDDFDIDGIDDSLVISDHLDNSISNHVNNKYSINSKNDNNGLYRNKSKNYSPNRNDTYSKDDDTSVYSIYSSTIPADNDGNNTSYAEVTSPLLMYADDHNNNDIRYNVSANSRQPSFSSPSLNYSSNNTNKSDSVLDNKHYEAELKELELKENEINRVIADMVFGGSTDIKKQQSLATERNEIKKKMEDIKQMMKVNSTKLNAMNDGQVICIDDDDDFEEENNNNLDGYLESNENMQTVKSFYFMSTDKTTATPTTTAITNKVTSLVNREDNYPWSKDVRRVLSQVFKLQDFRPNQLEAINTTLKGEDAFVLMPTGGGKSLCYQLPAIISGQYFNRSSSSVTIVVSPLLSLMHDQVAQLRERGITAGLLNGVITPEQRAAVFRGLSSNPPQFSLIYVTPEMIRQSGLFQNTVQKLYNLKQLARFVIDEAHCVSQWGHDFRPDYKMLGELKIQYKDIPIIALTATANQRVQSDIINSLHISNCKIFKQSFNRPNLKYEIVKGITKYNQRIDDISDFIKRRFRNQCGIVYCQTRKQCEDVAKRLYETHNIKTDYYHAARESEERIALQEKWQRGEYKVLVATIAFGMGIDKADVRFVIHFALPSSVEGYYQETGRAGRDGLDATCRLYYSFNDSKTHTMIIDKGEGDYRVKEFQRNNLRVMVQYCDNEMDCRRKQILGYFGEVFDTRLCQGSTMCDNCRKNQGKNMVEQDYTSMALGILHILKYLLDIDEKVTLIQLGDIFRGYGPKRLQGKGVESCPGFINNKDGTKLNKNETQRLTNHMVVCGILELRNEVNMGGYTSSYVYFGKYADHVFRGMQKVILYNTEENTKRNTSNQRTSSMSSSITTQSEYINSYKRDDTLDISSSVISTSTSSRPRRVMPSTTKSPRKQKLDLPMDPVRIECYSKMREQRTNLKSKFNVSNITTIYSDNELKLLVLNDIPTNQQEYLNILPDQKKYQNYGKYFLTLCRQYAKKL